jgi:hypothetical protein
MVVALLFLILFAILFPRMLRFTFVLMLLGGIMILGGAHAALVPLNTACGVIVGNGWDRMPDVADYIRTRPGADKLGYGSECNLRALVFSQCWIEPHWSVAKAIDVLLHKAENGEKLPDTPACGA